MRTENEYQLAVNEALYWRQVAMQRGAVISYPQQRPTCDAGLPTQTTCRRCPEPHVVSWTAKAPTLGDVARGQYQPSHTYKPRWELLDEGFIPCPPRWAGKGDPELFTEPGEPSWTGKGDPLMFTSDLMEVEYYWPTKWLTSLGVWLGECVHGLSAAFSRFTSNKAP